MNSKLRLWAMATLFLSSAVLAGCKHSGNPYDEFEILPLEEAPATPEAPDADASIAAEDRDAAVEEPEKPASTADGAEAPVFYAQARLQSKSVPVGGTLSADIRLVSMDGGNGDGSFRTYLDGQELESEGGRVHFERTCNTPGTYYLQGVIYVETPSGTEKYPYSEAYTVE